MSKLTTAGMFRGGCSNPVRDSHAANPRFADHAEINGHAGNSNMKTGLSLLSASLNIDMLSDVTAIRSASSKAA